jgi:hypothetical protein
LAGAAGDFFPDRAEPAPRSSLFDRLPRHLGRRLVAVEAEDHYVRVHTELGSTLMLARFSDVIQELGRAGRRAGAP